MEKDGKKETMNLLKATRIKRILPVLLVILVPAAYAENFQFSLIFLSLAAILIYSSAGIYNAHKDRDYYLPGYFSKTIFFLIILALIVSFFGGMIVFAASLLWIFLGYIYNTFARHVVFGDNLIAGITHYALPILASSLLVGMQVKTSIYLSALVYLAAVCIGPLTNLKDIEKDRRKGYKTLVNSVRSPKVVSALFLDFSFLIICITYFFLGIRDLRLLLLLIPFFMLIYIIKKIFSYEFEKSLNLTRLYMMTCFIFLIFILTPDLLIRILGLSIVFLYLLSGKNGIL